MTLGVSGLLERLQQLNITAVRVGTKCMDSSEGHAVGAEYDMGDDYLVCTDGGHVFLLDANNNLLTNRLVNDEAGMALMVEAIRLRQAK